jgi:hypothetical protein
MKTLKFAENLVPLVISGQKTSSWRPFDDKNLQAGDELSLINKATGIEFATAKITAVKEKAFKDITEADFFGHEKYENREKFLAEYKLYYGDKFNDDTILKMIDFKILEIKKKKKDNIFTKKFEFISDIEKADDAKDAKWYDVIFDIVGITFFGKSLFPSRIITIVKLFLIVILGVIIGMGIFVLLGKLIIK